MNGLVKRSDVIDTANKFGFTDDNDKRRYLDFLDYCLKETKTAYDVNKTVTELRDTMGNKTQFEQGFHSALDEVENYGKVPTRESCD